MLTKPSAGPGMRFITVDNREVLLEFVHICVNRILMDVNIVGDRLGIEYLNSD